MDKKALIVHYRIGRTDGVSLEIEKRKRVLKKMGYKVFLASGPVQTGADFVVPELEFDSSIITNINKLSFGETSTPDQIKLKLMMEDVANKIAKKFEKIIADNKISVLFVHNIWSHGRHLPAAKGFYNLAVKTKIPVIATHHDFYWERESYNHPSCSYIKKYLNTYFVPKLSNVRHVVINSIAQTKVYKKYKVMADIIPDTFDFEAKNSLGAEEKNKLYKKINYQAGDLIFLQATRVVPRKGIELALNFINLLGQPNFRNKLLNKKLYNGKIFRKSSKIVFLLAGYAELGADKYLKKLKALSIKSKVIMFDISKIVSAQKNPTKIPLWNVYEVADVVTYPSLWEGWGNQFIEAIYAKKPVVLFEYPVFLKDIKPEGYEYVSLGNKYRTDRKTKLAKIQKTTYQLAVQKTINLITQPQLYKNITNQNYLIGKKNHSLIVLQHLLSKSLQKIL